jgi:hypothetical protein
MSSEAAMGGGVAQRPVLCVSEPKKTGARRALTRSVDKTTCNYYFFTHCLSYKYLMPNLSNLFYEIDSAEISFKRIMIRDILEVAYASSPSYVRNSQE